MTREERERCLAYLDEQARSRLEDPRLQALRRSRPERIKRRGNPGRRLL